jgi:hypothetical protein
MPPPPSPPPANVCSKGNFFEGCEKCGITVGVNCPPENTGLCCHKKTRVAVKAGLPEHYFLLALAHLLNIPVGWLILFQGEKA